MARPFTLNLTFVRKGDKFVCFLNEVMPLDLREHVLQFSIPKPDDKNVTIEVFPKYTPSRDKHRDDRDWESDREDR